MFGCHRYHQDWPLGAMCNEMKRVMKWIVKIQAQAEIFQCLHLRSQYISPS